MTPLTLADRELARVLIDILNRRQHLGKTWVSVLDVERREREALERPAPAAAISCSAVQPSTHGGAA